MLRRGGGGDPVKAAHDVDGAVEDNIRGIRALPTHIGSREPPVFSNIVALHRVVHQVSAIAADGVDAAVQQDSGHVVPVVLHECALLPGQGCQVQLPKLPVGPQLVSQGLSPHYVDRSLCAKGVSVKSESFLKKRHCSCFNCFGTRSSDTYRNNKKTTNPPGKFKSYTTSLDPPP